MKIIKDDTNRWRNIPCSQIGRINIVKMSIQPKAIYRFNALPIKLPTVFFTELEQIISQFVWKYKKTSNSQSNLEKEEWKWRNQPAWLQALLWSKSHQDSMVLAQRQKHRSMEQNGPETNPFTCGHLILDKGGKNIQWRKDNLFNKWCWENWWTTCKRMKLENFLTPYTKINSKLIKDINVRPETIKPPEENIGKTLSDINHRRILYDPPPRVMEIKAKINKWDLIKLKTFCTMEETTEIKWSRSVVSDSLQPMDCSPPGSSIHGVLQARILEWVAISLLQEIFLTQGSNPGLLHCGQML